MLDPYEASEPVEIRKGLNSLVIPVFRNEESIADLFRDLEILNEHLRGELEAVFVIDGSPDASLWEIQQKVAEVVFTVQVIEHSRNFGAFAAIATGLRYARGEYTAVMAADRQEPIELIKAFFKELQTDEIEIVIGARKTRSDPAFTQMSSNLFWWGFRKFVQPALPRAGVDVFGCSARVAKLLANLPESNSSLIALLYWVGFDRVEIGYDRKKREKGSSAWSVGAKVKYLGDSVYSFTKIPISLIIGVGLVGVLGSLALGAFVLFSWLAGTIQEPGYTTLILLQLASTSSVLIAIGIVGTYVWRTFENSKMRPKTVIQRRTLH